MCIRDYKSTGVSFLFLFSCIFFNFFLNVSCSKASHYRTAIANTKTCLNSKWFICLRNTCSSNCQKPHPALYPSQFLLFIFPWVKNDSFLYSCNTFHAGFVLMLSVQSSLPNLLVSLLMEWNPHWRPSECDQCWSVCSW